MLGDLTLRDALTGMRAWFRRAESESNLAGGPCSLDFKAIMAKGPNGTLHGARRPEEGRAPTGIEELQVDGTTLAGSSVFSVFSILR